MLKSQKRKVIFLFLNKNNYLEKKKGFFEKLDKDFKGLF